MPVAGTETQDFHVGDFSLARAASEGIPSASAQYTRSQFLARIRKFTKARNQRPFNCTLENPQSAGVPAGTRPSAGAGPVADKGSSDQGTPMECHSGPAVRSSWPSRM